MVINREFFFRGWLPAGLLINAKLVTTSPATTGQAVLKPILNAVPGVGWPLNQPRPVFPVEQATQDTAIILVDPLSEGTIALLPLGEWYGAGSPYLLGVNTWYEGRIRMVSGEDVMSIRLFAHMVCNYFSDSDESIVSKDVAAVTMACRHIVGKHTEQILATDAGMLIPNTMGWPPIVQDMGNSIPARVVNKVCLTGASFAGTRTIYSENNSAASPIPFIQCAVADGKVTNNSVKYFGVVLRLDKGTQKFYTLEAEGIMNQVADLDKANRDIVTIAISEASDQVVHYN